MPQRVRPSPVLAMLTYGTSFPTRGSCVWSRPPREIHDRVSVCFSSCVFLIMGNSTFPQSSLKGRLSSFEPSVFQVSVTSSLTPCSPDRCRLNDCLLTISHTAGQITVISKACAERCGLGSLIDTRYSGRAVGVGFARILGRIHNSGIR